jgi:hypothetical protein
MGFSVVPPAALARPTGKATARSKAGGKAKGKGAPPEPTYRLHSKALTKLNKHIATWHADPPTGLTFSRALIPGRPWAIPEGSWPRFLQVFSQFYRLKVRPSHPAELDLVEIPVVAQETSGSSSAVLPSDSV